MIIEQVVCNGCGARFNRRDDVDPSERGYVGMDATHHYCIKCANGMTVANYVAIRIREGREEKAKRKGDAA